MNFLGILVHYFGIIGSGVVQCFLSEHYWILSIWLTFHVQRIHKFYILHKVQRMCLWLETGVSVSPFSTHLGWSISEIWYTIIRRYMLHESRILIVSEGQLLTYAYHRTFYDTSTSWHIGLDLGVVLFSKFSTIIS